MSPTHACNCPSQPGPDRAMAETLDTDFPDFFDGDRHGFYDPYPEMNPAAVAAGAAAVGGVLSAGSSAIQFGRDVVSVVSDIGAAAGKAMSTLTFRSNIGRLRADGAPPNLNSAIGKYRFEITGRGAYGLATTNKYVFDLFVDHDCFNIRRAEISFNERLSSTSRTRGGVLKVTMRPRPQTYRSIPGMIEFEISGSWDPADMNYLGNDLVERFLATLKVRADGRVTMRPQSGRYFLVRAPYRTQRAAVSCQRLYHALRAQRSSTPSAPTPARSAPTAPTPQRPFGGRSSRPSSSGRRPPHPRNGLHVFFAFSRASPRDIVRNDVQRWWSELDGRLQKMITDGHIRVRVTGHGDPVGSATTNLRISSQRANLVANAVRALAGPRARVDARGVGIEFSQRAVSGRAPEWRRATIELEMGG